MQRVSLKWMDAELKNIFIFSYIFWDADSKKHACFVLACYTYIHCPLITRHDLAKKLKFT